MSKNVNHTENETEYASIKDALNIQRSEFLRLQI